MKILPAKCVKCGCVMFSHGRPTFKYNEVVVKLEGLSKQQRIGICPDCDITEDDYEELCEVLNRDSKSGCTKVTGIKERLSFVDVLKDIQSEACWRCGEALGDKWIQTNGFLKHESC